MNYKALTLAALLGLGAPLAGCDNDSDVEDTMEDAGDKMGDAMDDAGDEMGDAMDDARDQMGDTMDDMGDAAEDADEEVEEETPPQ